MITGHIKQLLHDFNLPMLPVFTEESIPAEGRAYIKDDNVQLYENGKFRHVTGYTYGVDTLGLTKNLQIKSTEYDVYTHNYLGDYLRFMRDYHKVNLMSMYNCFFGQMPGKLTHKFETLSINTTDGAVYYIVPVKFNQLYTIAIDSAVPYELTTIIYDNMFISTTPDELVEESHRVVHGSMFSQPYLYDTHFSCYANEWHKEANLYLLLRLPSGFKSSITILEGNWLECANVVNGKFNANQIIADNGTVFISKLQLLRLNDTRQHPFADRLIEYLLGNIIGKFDSYNIGRIQDKMEYYNYPGVWTNKFRNVVYDAQREKDYSTGQNDTRIIDNYFDLNGFVDKDTEWSLEVMDGQV